MTTNNSRTVPAGRTMRIAAYILLGLGGACLLMDLIIPMVPSIALDTGAGVMAAFLLGLPGGFLLWRGRRAAAPKLGMSPNHPSRHIHAISLAAWLIVGLSLAPCHAQSAQQPAQLDPAAVNDAKLIERMEKLRARALKAPGGAIEASDFASHVTMLFTQGVAKRRPFAPAIVDEAARCLDQAGDAKPEFAADLLVRKGELLRAAGRSSLVSIIIAWVVIVILGLGSLIITGMAWDDAWSVDKVLRVSLGFVLFVLAWVVWRNLSSANLVVGWVLCIVLGILGPILTWAGIDNLHRRVPRHLKQYLMAGGGISSTVLAILVAILWLGINNLAGWLSFLILGIVSFVLIGWSIYDFVALAFKEATLRLAVGCISTILTLVISYFWLRSTPTLHLIEWVCFLIVGILGAAAIIWGLLMSVYGDNRNERKSGILFLLGGTAGIALGWITGVYLLRLAWLTKVNFWNPFVILPTVTLLAGVILGFLVNLLEDAVYKGGSQTVRSAEWRIVGSNAKYRDATVRDVHDHAHGRGSWAKSTRRSILFWRIICVLLSALGPIGCLLFTHLKDAFPACQVVLDEFGTYSRPLLVLLGVILLFLSGLVALVFGSKSKHQ